ncbi:MAG: 3-hydroxyacyl-ACP dehydratase FabZ [Cyanobacteriota bacterium]
MNEAVLDIKKIWETIPHRYPFLLVDRVTEFGESYIVGYKNLSINEPFFNGHFPGEPIMPGVLICEAAAQLGAIFLKRHDNFKDKLILFAGIDGVRFKRLVVPGDKLDLRVDVLKIKGRVGKASFEAKVDGALATSGEITFSAV